MGTWGIGLFENDTALDFMADLEASEDPKSFLSDAFENALRDDYLDADEAVAAVVAAAYVDRQVNGTTFSGADRDEPLEVDTFPERHPRINLFDLRDQAIAALVRVTGDDSELGELWGETGEYDAWKAGIMAIAQRLRN